MKPFQLKVYSLVKGLGLVKGIGLPGSAPGWFLRMNGGLPEAQALSVLCFSNLNHGNLLNIQHSPYPGHHNLHRQEDREKKA